MTVTGARQAGQTSARQHSVTGPPCALPWWELPSVPSNESNLVLGFRGTARGCRLQMAGLCRTPVWCAGIWRCSEWAVQEPGHRLLSCSQSCQLRSEAQQVIGTESFPAQPGGFPSGRGKAVRDSSENQRMSASPTPTSLGAGVLVV